MEEGEGQQPLPGLAQGLFVTSAYAATGPELSLNFSRVLQQPGQAHWSRGSGPGERLPQIGTVPVCMHRTAEEASTACYQSCGCSLC